MSENEPHRSVLGPDCKASGELSIDGDGAIMGQFKGVVRAAGILDLTDSSHVSGTIVAGAVRLGGRAEVDIVAEHGVELLCGSVSTGRLFTTRLSVVDGASFDGQVVVGANAVEAAGDVLRQTESDRPDAERADGQSQADAATDLEVQMPVNSLDRILQSQDRQPFAAGTTAARAG